MNDDANELDLLGIRNDTFVREISYHDELESTNKTAVELASTDCQTPLLVIARQQTAGRGRGSNTWWSNEGALTFTLLLDLPMLAPERLSSFSLTAGLAICQAIEQFAPVADLALKWPNDVYMNDRKICGILTEKPIASEPRLAIGVGINVNNSLRDAPDALQKRATSIVDTLESELPLSTVLTQCLATVELRMRDHIHNEEALLDQWRAYCMLTGRDVEVEMHGRVLRGKCRGIDVDGALVVDDGEQQHHCVAGVVSSFEGDWRS